MKLLKKKDRFIFNLSKEEAFIFKILCNNIGGTGPRDDIFAPLVEFLSKKIPIFTSNLEDRFLDVNPRKSENSIYFKNKNWKTDIKLILRSNRAKRS